VIGAVTNYDGAIRSLVVFELRHQLLRALATVLRTPGQGSDSSETRSCPLAFGRERAVGSAGANDAGAPTVGGSAGTGDGVPNTAATAGNNATP
jgi:hypothetical protein